MTNSKAIKQLKHQVYKNTDNCEMKISKDCYKAIINSLEENTKLKAEIEHLKSELEKSVIPCTHGYDKRQNEIGETLIFCEHTDNWMNVTLGNCLGNCEAEQHLKGKVEE